MVIVDMTFNALLDYTRKYFNNDLHKFKSDSVKSVQPLAFTVNPHISRRIPKTLRASKV